MNQQRKIYKALRKQPQNLVNTAGQVKDRETGLYREPLDGDTVYKKSYIRGFFQILNRVDGRWVPAKALARKSRTGVFMWTDRLNRKEEAVQAWTSKPTGTHRKGVYTPP